MTKVAYITHAGSFVGPATVAALAEAGFAVYAHACPDGARATAIAAADPADGVAETVARAGRLDALVSNDVHPAERAPVADTDPEVLRTALEALSVTPFRAVGAATPHLIDSGGRIVLVTSAAPLRGLANYAPYCAARAAANALVPALAKELAKSGVTINAIAPNFLRTPAYFPDALLADPEVERKIRSNVPLDRLGDAREAAAMIRALVSPDTGFVTGQVVAVDGGWS